MQLSPSRADCVVFELEGVLAEISASDQAEPRSCKPLFGGRWDKLPLPVGVASSLSREETADALKTLGWDDLPASHAAGGENALESLCRSLGCRWPLVLGSSQRLQDMTARLGRGDFVAVGHSSASTLIRFSSAADALRAILGVV
ncbi:MAG: hypothetical protein IJU32_04845 [Pyramidobacter sp.]|nr:hypothetical protein [Pyramidobacter sp.]